MSNAHTDSYATKTVETSTHSNVGPVPEQDPMLNSRNVDYNDNINRDINKDYNRDVVNLSETGESKGIVSSVVEAARLAATRVREAFVGEPTTTTSTLDDRSSLRSDEQIRRTDDKDLTFGTHDKTTSEKIKDTAYDAKEKIKDTAYDAKEKIKDTSRDIKDKVKDVAYDMKDKSKDASRDLKDTSKDTNYEMKSKAKDTARDVKDKVKDTAYDIKDKAKDTAYDIKDKTKDTTRDVQQDRKTETRTFEKDSLSADSDIAADSNTQRLRDIKEKVKDAAQAPVEIIQTMLAASKDKMQEAMNNRSDQTTTTTTTTTQPIAETPGTSDMFSDTYQPGLAPYEPSTTEQAKSKLASTAANAADKAENWIADNKYKLGEQADKAQDLAADVKFKAAQEAGKEPASDTRYYSGVHGQTY